MPISCKCGWTKCLDCIGECPRCHDIIENYKKDKKENTEELTCLVRQ